MIPISEQYRINIKNAIELIDNMPEDFATKRTCFCEKALSEAEF